MRNVLLFSDGWHTEVLWHLRILASSVTPVSVPCTSTMKTNSSSPVLLFIPIRTVALWHSPVHNELWTPICLILFMLWYMKLLVYRLEREWRPDRESWTAPVMETKIRWRWHGLCDIMTVLKRIAAFEARIYWASECGCVLSRLIIIWQSSRDLNNK